MVTPQKNPHDDLSIMKQRVFMWSVVFVILVAASAALVYFVFIKDEGMFNRAQEAAQVTCGEIKTFTTCYGRRDCVPVDKCTCVSDYEHELRCGKTPALQCDCTKAGFDHCEKLLCQATNVNQ